MRKRYLKQRLSFEEDKIKHWKSFLREAPQEGKWFCYWQINIIQDEVNKLQKNIYYINRLLTGAVSNKMIDINLVKDIPINQVMEALGHKPVSRNQYLCPIHNEKTPSFHIREKENKFKCFGCNAGGSTVDLVMHINKCNCGEAIKYLSTMI